MALGIAAALAISAGASIVGGLLKGKSQRQAESKNRREIRRRIAQALAQLTPEQIGQLARQFLPEIQSIASPLQQTQLQRLNASLARRGLGESPIGATAEAGLRGQQINQSAALAFQQGIGLAGQRAGAITGTPLQQFQPNTAIAGAFGEISSQVPLLLALTQGGGKNIKTRTLPSFVQGGVAGVPTNFGIPVGANVVR